MFSEPNERLSLKSKTGTIFNAFNNIKQELLKENVSNFVAGNNTFCSASLP